MAEIAVYTAAFLKRGAPIMNASFAQVLYDGLFKGEHEQPLTDVSGGVFTNIYNVGLFTGADGDVRVSAPNHKPKTVHVVSLGSYEVLLDKV